MKQLTLLELIRKVKAFYDYQASIEVPKIDGKVYFDFEYFFPTKIDSWRGDYSHLALNIETANQEKAVRPLTIVEFLHLLRDADGREFEGYKGGTYIAGDSTPIWVANWGDSGRTVVCGVARDYDDLILLTKFERY